MQISERAVPGFERVVIGRDDAAGYHGIVVVHSSALGPAVGGTRYWRYHTEEEALTDALRLARGMTYKCALAGLPLGGGKSVILGDPARPDRETIFRAHGRLVEFLGGLYKTGEDVNTSPSDMDFVRMETEHVGGLAHRSGDPSPATAHGVVRAMMACARHVWGSDRLGGRHVAIQGCGHVGAPLARELHALGVSLTLADIDEARATGLAVELNARQVPAADIYDVEADIYAPCALGAVLNDETIPRLKARVICGAANNQLAEPRHGDAVEARGLVYAPDYAVNAGGVINGGSIEVLGWAPQQAAGRIEAIYDTIREILEVSRRRGIPAYRAADELAERKFLGVTPIG